MRIIELTKYRTGKSRVFAGRPRGEIVRGAEGLEFEDEKPEPVLVRVPEDLYSLNVSFMLGLFGRSVLRLGGKEAFFQKYQFEARPDIKRDIELGVDYALKHSSVLRNWK